MAAWIGDISSLEAAGRSRLAATLIAAAEVYLSAPRHSAMDRQIFASLVQGMLAGAGDAAKAEFAAMIAGRDGIPEEITAALRPAAAQAEPKAATASADWTSHSITLLEDLLSPADYERLQEDPLPVDTAIDVDLESALAFALLRDGIPETETEPDAAGLLYDPQDIGFAGPDDRTAPAQAGETDSGPAQAGETDTAPAQAGEADTAPAQAGEADSGPAQGLPPRTSDLDMEVLAALVGNGEAAHAAMMVRNARGVLEPGILQQLLSASHDMPLMAAALAERPEVPDSELVQLFFVLGKRGRRRVIAALELMSLKELVKRQALPPRRMMDAAAMETLALATAQAESGDASHLVDCLATSLGICVPVVEQILLDRGAEPLALALRALDVPPALAMRLLRLTAGHSGRDDMVAAGMRLLDGLSQRAAQIVVDHWQGPLLRTVSGRHVPLYAGPATGAAREASGKGTAVPRQHKAVSAVTRF